MQNLQWKTLWKKQENSQSCILCDIEINAFKHKFTSNSIAHVVVSIKVIPKDFWVITLKLANLSHN